MTTDIFLRISSEHASAERNFPIEWTVGKFKERIESITGVPPAAQSLTVTDPSGGNRRSLTSFASTDKVMSMDIITKSHVYVTDLRPKSEQFDFDGEVDKYEMPISEYEKRTDSVLAWKKKNQLGRFQNAEAESSDSEVEVDCDLEVGQTCWVKLASGDMAHGTVAYIGAVEGIPAGTWVGVKLQKPLGKNDGSVLGKRYFDAEPQFGLFTRPSLVTADSDDLDEL